MNARAEDPSSDETLFAEALARPAAERAAFLDQACIGDPARRTRLEALLQVAEPAQQFLEPSATVATRPMFTPPPEEKSGDMIGRYKLLQKLGEGGCGVVYMAEQEEPVRRRVALKVIKLGMDTKEVIARFEAERQALAMMDHPNIAKVLDAGATATGRPFFVMELVRGIPLTKFCDENNLPTADRLKLFTAVCHAIQHAHQKGIIHRDIKPSNILVTLHDGEPVPKVIDFGIAKATAGRLTNSTLYTAFEQFIGTPAYMSPEQAELSGLDIDTRSDIYSLGVLLYELLTGRTPFDSSELLKVGLDTMRRHIREVDPPKPSTRLSTLQGEALSATAKLRQIAPPKLINLIRGDLDWIVMKALEKNRARRYETANALADDIARHLAHEPVAVCPPSAAYRLGKLVRRHKLGFAAGAAVAAALVGGLSLSTWMFFRERAARERAVAAEQEQIVQRQKADEARMEEKLQRSMADQARSYAEQNAKKAEQEAAISKAVSSFLSDDLLRQADSSMQIASKSEPNPDLKVREALDRAAERVGPRFKNQPLTEAAVRDAIASAYQGVGDFAKAVVHFGRALELRKATLGPEHPATLDTMSALAWALHTQGKFAECAKLVEQTWEIQKRLFGPEHSRTLQSMTVLANNKGGMGRHAEAAALRAQILEISKRVLGPENPGTLAAMTNLTASHLRAGKFAEAAALGAEAWEIEKRVFGAEHPSTLMTMHNLAVAHRALGKQAEAAELCRQTLDLQRRVNGPEHPATLLAMVNLAAAHAAQGKRAEAIALLSQTLEISKRIRGPEHPRTLEVMTSLAAMYLDQGRAAESVTIGLEVCELQKRVLGPEHPDTLATMADLARAYRELGRIREAVELRTRLLEMQQRVLGPKHAATLSNMQSLARARETLGENAEAETLLRKLHSLTEGNDSVQTMLGWVCVKQQKYPEAEALLRPVRARRDEKQPDLWTTFVTRYALGGALAGQKKYAEAEPLLVSGGEEILKRIGTIPALDKERVTEALEQLVQLYTAWDKPEKTTEWRKKLDEWKSAQTANTSGKPPMSAK